MNKNIDCKIIAEKIKDNVVKEVMKFNGARPNLAIILVGDRADSKLYVNLKEKEAKKVGIDTHLYRCDKDIAEPEIFSMIELLNKDDMIDAMLVQLPLPKQYDTDGIIFAMDPAKDVDRFHPDNLKRLFETCNHGDVIPPVFKVVTRILDELEFDPKGKRAGILANSEIFGKGLAKVLECRGAKTEYLKSDDKDLAAKTTKCDILVTAIGKPQFIKKEMVKKDAVIIDVGINREQGKIYGDVDYDDVKDKAAYITPVPGGVGPLTIAMLFENVVELYKNRRINADK